MSPDQSGSPAPLDSRHVIRRFRLGEEPPDDLSASTSAEERVAMVALLSQRQWTLTGRPVPSYTRAAMPVRLLRRA